MRHPKPLPVVTKIPVYYTIETTVALPMGYLCGRIEFYISNNVGVPLYTTRLRATADGGGNSFEIVCRVAASCLGLGPEQCDFRERGSKNDTLVDPTLLGREVPNA